MNIIRVTSKQLQERLTSRPPEYLSEIEPAITQRHDDGSISFDTGHSAWKAAMAKYRPAHRPVTPKWIDPCKTCEHQPQCPVAYLPICKRKRALRGDPMYPLPDYCPQKKESSAVNYQTCTTCSDPTLCLIDGNVCDKGPGMCETCNRRPKSHVDPNICPFAIHVGDNVMCKKGKGGCGVGPTEWRSCPKLVPQKDDA